MNSPAMTLPYDVAVIGGGIHGAGIAQAAAAGGYHTLLIEKSHWAAGTSSKSSKLIHGGLRYLQTGQFTLVKESLQERELLLQLAPELVTRQDFYIPLYRHSALSSWKLRLGLSLYSFLAGRGPHNQYRKIPASEWQNLHGLQTDGLKSVFSYSDAQTDDEALTQAVVESARQLGATLLCPAELISAERNRGGYQIHLSRNPQGQPVQCRFLINASGPWANEIAARVTPKPESISIDLVQGTHLVFEKPLNNHCFYLEAPQDGRAVFVLPWHGGTLVGTTETLFKGSPDQCVPLPKECEYLMEVVRHYFPDWHQEPQSAFAGLRVLPKAHHKGSMSHPFRRSREVQLAHGDNYLGVYGGKLTGYRATANKVMEEITNALGKRTPKADTAKLGLKPVQKTVHSASPNTKPHNVT